MLPVNPEPYVAAYVVLVFLVPWLIYCSFIVRKLLYARKSGISLISSDASVRIRALRQSDSYASYLHQRCLRWFVITLSMWVLGFGVLGLTLYLLYLRGIV